MATPKSAFDVVTALMTQLKAYGDLAALDPTIERSREVNNDSSKTPWVCCYRYGVEFTPRTLGPLANRRQTIHLVIACQASDPISGEKCEERLEELIKFVMAALLSDVTIGGTVVMLDEKINVQYPDVQLRTDQYTQTAFIQFAAITVVQ